MRGRTFKKRTGKYEQSSYGVLRETMTGISKAMMKTLEEMRILRRLRQEHGDDTYFQALADAHNLRAAFAEFVVEAKYFQSQSREGPDFELGK